MLRTLIRTTICSATLALAAGIATGPLSGQDVTGMWILAVDLDAGSGDATFVFEQDGETLTGTYTGVLGERLPVTGTIEGDEVKFQFSEDQVGTVTFEGTLDGNMMEGDCDYGLMGSGVFRGTKRESGAIK